MNLLKKAVVLGGQTASGKSSLALELCRGFDGEIISADSMQVYKSMDIGTAKPGKDDLSRVRHHLIDILDITEKFSSADFVSLGTKALEDITSRGKISFVTGGTGLYSEMLFNSFSLSENAANEQIKKSLWERVKTEGNQSLYEQLREIDPETALKVHPNNTKRLIRYLEISLATGKTPSEINQANNSGERRYDPLYICLYSEDRELIYTRINKRIDEMFDKGLLEEVYALWQKGLENTPTASAAIGYKELFPYFKGEITLENVKEKIKQNSRNYAKRQQTYFRHINGVKFIDIKDIDYPRKVTDLIKDFFEK
ncbi:MAG: tRNA (adenosine(37)-N6)-dimethylallyltransferase MiaA [Clostridiales bacterium]|jgi:tRNA dimethylallyltransferase|nr:tRNA (adenosine(37)-N6)-dimethylallyltransferase MiaA [Clostridiales bacterium]